MITLCLLGPGDPSLTCSALLTYMVHYARANDWICLFVPNTFAIAREGKVLIPSKSRPGMVDQPDIAIDILRNVRGAGCGW
jgi:hypothetical protein